jgi:hypothetical protein
LFFVLWQGSLTELDILDESYPNETFVGFAHSSKGTKESSGFLETCGKTFSEPRNVDKDLDALFDLVCEQCSTDTIKIFKTGTTDGKKIVLRQGSNSSSTSSEHKPMLWKPKVANGKN